ncbi:MAG: glycosyl hydrolase [Verrucomicrobia bacterium]|nr:glycosyl hydrolase [Verrucomicrobiota bacterium]
MIISRSISSSVIQGLGTLLLMAQVVFAAEPNALESGFRNPPPEAHPLVWWHWINGNVTKEGIRADLEDMKRVGIGGAQILDVEIYLPKGPVRYGTDSWHEHIQYAIKTAAQLGLEIDVANSPGWSGSGGPWITPERSMKQIVWSEVEADGGPVSLALPQPAAKLGFYREIAVIAVPPTSERLEKMPAKIGWATKPVSRPAGAASPGIPADKVINLTGKMDASGKLTATLPPGRWVILRFGYSATGATNHPAQPEGKGLEADKLDPETVAFEFEHSLGRIIREAGPLAGKTLKGILFDSFEAGFQNWTAHFSTEFTKRKGYDFIPWLPVITGRIVQTQDASESVLWDFRNVIDELFADNYFGTMHKLAAAHGMKIYSESEGGPLNPMSANRHVDVPMNEFWMPDMASRASRIKMTTSAAGFLGRNIIGAEAFTATPENGKFQATPATCKNPGDYAFTVGINRFIFHHYTHQPVTEAAPGFALGRYGTHFGRLNTWWPYADAWISYLTCSQFLLQQGRTVADLCVLADEDIGYGLPSKMANLVPGYDFNVCSPSDFRAMSVRDGRIVHPQGQSYSLLILPENWVAETSTLRHLQKLLQDGATILGNAPVAPAGLRDVQARGEFSRLVAEIWGDGAAKKASSKKIGGGTLCQNIKPGELLKKLGSPPDLTWSAAEADFKYIHRATADEDIYFIFNYSANPIASELSFRQKGRQPEIWDAVSGTQADAPMFTATKDGVTVPISFEPWGSAFVIFRKPLPKRWITAAPGANLELRDGAILYTAKALACSYSDGAQQTVPLANCPANQTIQGPWKVTFKDGRGAPPAATFEKLISWTDHSDTGIKYYSGTAVYKTTFQSSAAKEGQAAILDLGTVDDIAKVVVNGQSAGVLWKPPFRADVSRLLRDGANTLEIQVANRWINRLIGDEAIPVEYTYQKPGKGKFTDGRLEVLPSWLYDASKRSTRKRYSFFTWKHFDADSPLVPSGLLGPVQIEWYGKLQLSKN